MNSAQNRQSVTSAEEDDLGIVRSLCHLERQVALLVDQIADMHTAIAEITCGKDWYSTSEVASLMGVIRHTVQERWCNAGRIECEKDPATGKWRIPGHEYERLRRGGRPEGY